MRAGSLADRYGGWALVAGASEGLGAAFAEELARGGMNLFIVARRSDVLEKAAGELRSRHRVEVRTLALDLSRPDAYIELEKSAAGLEVGVLVCNAALAHTGPFLEAEPELYARMLDLNCRSTLMMIRLFAAPMVQRGRGGIIVMSSMAGLQGSPYVTVYGATKAFLITLAEGLAWELSPRGVDVTVCAASAVRTPGYLSSTQGGAKSPVESEPVDVARTAIRALGRKSFVVPGFAAKAARFMMSRLMPRRAAVSMMGRTTRALFERSKG